MKQPKWSIRNLEYAVSDRIFLRGKNLFQSGKVVEIREFPSFYSGIVQSTHDYQVSISEKEVDLAECNCYMGENGEFCKHIIALGLAVLKKSGKNNKREIPRSLEEVKLMVSKGLRKIKPYTGPSSIWFKYQRQLDIGSFEIEEAISVLKPSVENAKYLWKLVLKLSKKLSEGGIDDSDGRVGSCISLIVEKCGSFGKQDESLIPLLRKFAKDDTGFGFEEELSDMLE